MKSAYSPSPRFAPALRRPAALGAAALLLLGAGSAEAGSFTLNSSDNGGTSSFAAAGNWSSGAAPASGNSYTVGSGLILRTPVDTADYTFGGVGASNISLTIDNGQIRFKNTSPTTDTFTNLILKNGGILNQGGDASSNTGTTTIAGLLSLGVGGGVFDTNNTGIGNTAVRAFNFTSVIQDLIGSPGNGLTLQGGGLITFQGANTYTGTTTLLDTTNLAGTGAVTQAETLQVGIGGAVGSLGTGNVVTNTGTMLAFNLSSNYTLLTTNVISGAGAVTQIGTGITTFTAANTYTGGTTISAGTLNVGSAGAIGAAGTLSFTGGTLQYSAANNTDYSSRFSTAANQAYKIDTNGQNITYGTALTSVGGSLTKSGAGTLTLSGNNTYSGATNVNGGILTLSGNNTLTGITTVTAGELILSGNNSATTGNIIAAPPTTTNNTTLATAFNTAVVSAQSTNALGTGNLSLLNGNQNGTPAGGQAVLEIGATLDNAGNQFSLQRTIGNGAGQINLGGANAFSNVGFAAIGGLRTVELTTKNSANTTTAVAGATIESKFSAFVPNGGGDGYVFGDATANNTVVLINGLDLEGTAANRNLRTVRGVGSVPEGMLTGTLRNGGSANQLNFDGTGGLVLNNVNPSGNFAAYANPISPGLGTDAGTTNGTLLRFYSGGLFVGSSDAATNGVASPLGNNNAPLTIGDNTAFNTTTESTPLGAINTGLMTYGSGTTGAGATSSIVIARNLTLGTGGTGIISVGGFTADHTSFTGAINLNGANLPTFTAKTGGQVDFTGVISGAAASGQALAFGNTIIEGGGTTYGANTAGTGISVDGGGLVTLSNANTYTSGSTINNGTVKTTSTSALGTGAVTLNGGTLQLAASNTLSGFGAGYTLNGGATQANNVLTLTDNGQSEARSAFTTSAQTLTNAGGFTSSFVYTPSGNKAADGVTFAIQNDSRGATALGGNGGSFGYGNTNATGTPISSSGAIELNIYTGVPGGVGTAFGINGSVPTTTTTGSVNLASGDPIKVDLTYSGATLTEKLTDQTTLATFTTSYTGVDFQSLLGGTSGYVGFTGGTGGLTATQTISNFTFNSGAAPQTYANNIAVTANSTIDVTGKLAATVGTLSIGGNTLSVKSDDSTLGAYSLKTGATTLTGNATVNVANNSTGAGTVTLGAVSGGTNSLTKTGAGTLVLSGAGSYTGGTTVNAGTLQLAVANADGGGSLTVSSGGTVTVTANNAINNSAPVTLSAGSKLVNAKLNANDPNASHEPTASSNVQNLGILTLNGSSILDFGAGNTGAVFSFADSHTAAWTGTLSVWDWNGGYPTSYDPTTQIGTTGGDGLDQLYFGTSSSGLTLSQLQDIKFYSDGGTTLLGSGTAIILADGEVSPAPEPGQWAVLSMIGLGMGGLLLRARKRLTAAKASSV